MKRIIKKIKQNLIGFIVGAIIFSIIGVYAATQIASSNVTYRKSGATSDITVNDALNELFDKTKKCSGNNCKCKRATTLHTEKCSQTDTSGYCRAAGYAANATITYGQLGHSGTLRPGDAFDCDVNGDGTYNATNERFYYVATTNGIVTLIYYNNTSGGTANNTTAYAYHSGNNNYEGPVTAIAQLPTTSQWKNVSLSNTTRAIKNELGGATTTGGTLPTAYSYSGYAARLLTVQEVNAACAITTGSYTIGELDTCQYLMENMKFSSSSMGTYGYWLETPRSSLSNGVWYVYGYGRYVNLNYANTTSNIGVRPTIEVSINDIEY